MTDYDRQIAAKRSKAERMRNVELPRLASVFCDVAADWASGTWEKIIRDAIAEDPRRAMDHRDQLPELKAALAELRDGATAVAREHLAPRFLHESESDESLANLVTQPRYGGGELTVRFPWQSSTRSDDPIRRLVGAIGPALARAGLVGEQTAVNAGGRYRYQLDAPSDVVTAKKAYEDGLRALAELAFEARSLEQAKAREQAASLWDEA